MTFAYDVAVVVPVYNAEHSLGELHSRVRAALVNAYPNYHLVFVNDCSKDDSLRVLRDLADRDARVTCIDLFSNVGQFRALLCGLLHANARSVITMDDDLQHVPEEIPRLLQALHDDPDCDIVLGADRHSSRSWFRRAGSAFVNQLNGLMFNKPKELTMSAFRAMRGEVVEILSSYNTIFPVMGPLLMQITPRIKNVDIAFAPRKHGQSNYSFYKLIRTTLDNVVNFSSLPLRWIGLVGISVFVLSLCMAVVASVRYFYFGSMVSGWTSLFVSVNFFGGLLALSIGIIGEYLIRILKEVKGYPKFSIRQVYRGAQEHDS